MAIDVRVALTHSILLHAPYNSEYVVDRPGSRDVGNTHGRSINLIEDAPERRTVVSEGGAVVSVAGLGVVVSIHVP